VANTTNAIGGFNDVVLPLPPSRRMSAKVLFFALDASEPRLLQKLMRDGQLPFLASLDRDGSGLPVTNLKGFGDGVFWPCVSTGVNPARHGRMYSVAFDPAQYRATRFDDDAGIRAKQFWQILDDNGLETATIDVVHASLRPLQRGLMLCDWMTHERHLPPRSCPTDLAERILAEFGDDPLGGTADEFIIQTQDYVEFVRRLEARIDTKTRALEALLQSRSWDVFTCSFGEPHDVGHLCWHLHEAGHPRFEERLAVELGDPVSSIYKSLDRSIGKLHAAAGPDTRVIVLAGPGMERMNTLNRSLDRVLLRLEERRASVTSTSRPSPMTWAKRQLSNAWRRYASNSLRSTLAKGALVGPVYRHVSRRVREHRKFFAQPHNANAGAIRINLIGREANGKVQAGEEFEETLQFLTRELQKIHDRKGRPLVADIAYPTTEYQGDYAHALTDMLVIWNRNADVSDLVSPTIGPISDRSLIPRTGDHNRDGYIWISGWGRSLQSRDDTMGPMDVAPTLFDLLNLNTMGLEGRSFLKPDKSEAA
jgi:predicted AlkP superfamily phosphohydrolase/phosphomutase